MNFALVVSRIVNIANSLIAMIAALALVVFIYGLVVYMFNSGNEESRQESIKYIINGIIGFFVMVTVWGILTIVASTFGFSLSVPRI